METVLKNYAIILASGDSKRFGNDLPKQFEKIGEKSILELSIEAFEQCSEIDRIIVVTNPNYRELTNQIISKNSYKKIFKITDGGAQRKDSSRKGVNSVEDYEANVLIHDCARPFVSQRIIKDCIRGLEKHSAVCAAIETRDTIFEVSENIIKNIPQRKTLRCAQTPQGFKLSIIKKAHELTKGDNDFTDDCGIVLKHNLCPIYLVEGDIENIKITYKQDIKNNNIT